MPDYLKDLMDKYQETKKQQEEALNKLKTEAQKEFEPLIKNVIAKGIQLKETDQRVKTLEQDLKDTRTSYAKQLTDIKQYYNTVVNAIPLPEYQEMFDREIKKEDPELLNVLHEEMTKTMKRVTKYLKRQAQFIDPTNGKTFATWQEAADYWHLDTHSDSAHRVFERERGYPLLELTDTTVTAVNDCINTPGCVETAVGGFIADTNKTKEIIDVSGNTKKVPEVSPDDSNALLDHIFEFLKEKGE